VEAHNCGKNSALKPFFFRYSHITAVLKECKVVFFPEGVAKGIAGKEQFKTI
jgi:hypothetical protein